MPQIKSFIDEISNTVIYTTSAQNRLNSSFLLSNHCTGKIITREIKSNREISILILSLFYFLISIHIFILRISLPKYFGDPTPIIKFSIIGFRLTRCSNSYRFCGFQHAKTFGPVRSRYTNRPTYIYREETLSEISIPLFHNSCWNRGKNRLVYFFWCV